MDMYEKLRREISDSINAVIDKAFIEGALKAQEESRKRPVQLHAFTDRPCTCDNCRIQIASLMIRIFPRTANRWIQLRKNACIIMFDELGYVEGYMDPSTLKPLADTEAIKP